MCLMFIAFKSRLLIPEFSGCHCIIGGFVVTNNLVILQIIWQPYIFWYSLRIWKPNYKQRTEIRLEKNGNYPSVWILSVPCKVVMQGKLFQKCTHLLYYSVLSLGGNVNTRQMSQPYMGSIFHIKNEWNILVKGNYHVNYQNYQN